MVTYQSDVNAEYYKKLNSDLDPMEIIVQPYRVKVEQIFSQYKALEKDFLVIRKEFDVLTKRVKHIESRFHPFKEQS